LASRHASEAAGTDRFAAARKSGLPVVGTIGAGIPPELIRAAGCVPVALSARAMDHGRIAAPMEVGHEAEVRSLFVQSMSGDFAPCDVLVIASSSDGYRYLYQYLKEMVRTGEGAAIPPLVLHDFLFGDSAPVRAYSRSIIEGLRDRLASLSGTPADAAAIALEIARTNAVRRRLAEVARLRDGCRIAGSTARAAIAVGGTIDPDAHAALLAALITDHEDTPALAGLRIVLAPSVPLYHDMLHLLVEGAGGVVIGEDDAMGARYGGPAIGNSTDPIGALCEHYRTYDATPRQLGPEREAWLAAKFDSGIDGVVFYLPPDDQFYGWRYPALSEAATAAGVATLLIRDDVLDPAGRAAATGHVTGFLASMATAR
jgi:benzoyl-CoA reductase/2-hydroxyglutaryl-CoA dehydratase subunit BcrC/BadD/HgdB